jgi:hypothetical protein
MERDTLYSLILLGLFALVVMRQRFTTVTLEVLMSLTRPGSTILLLGIALYMYNKGLLYTSLVFVLISVYLLKDIWVSWARSDARRQYLDLGRDQARFNEATSVDLQWANKTAIHDSPNMLRIDNDASPLLLYPPSQSTLESMCG